LLSRVCDIHRQSAIAVNPVMMTTAAAIWSARRRRAVDLAAAVDPREGVLPAGKLEL
jgi:hypothetical protein